MIVTKSFFKHRIVGVAISALQAGALMAIADLSEQYRNQHQNSAESFNYDLVRTRNMLSVGLMEGPILYYWYRWLDSYFKRGQLFKKILFDQGILSPILCTGYLYIMPLLNGEGHAAAKQEVRNKIIRLYLLDCLFWPGIQYVNFRFLPTSLRVTYVCSCTFLWNMILSFVRHET